MSARIVVAAIAISTIGAGCASQRMIPYDVDGPAQQLALVGAPTPTDGRARFREIFCTLLSGEPTGGAIDVDCERVLHRFSDEPAPPDPKPLPLHDTRLRILIVTGALGECVQHLATPFDQGVQRLAPLGYRIETLVVGGLSSSAYNAEMIAEAVAALELAPGERLLLLGYSKGVADIQQFFVAHPDLAERVNALVSVAGAVNGSPLGDHYHRSLPRWLMKPATLFCEGRDLGALQSVTRGERLRWLVANPLPAQVRSFSISSFTDRSRIPRLLRSAYRMLAPVDPRNDGQLLFTDQLVPGSTLLGYTNADHWAVALAFEERRRFWMSYPRRKLAYPRALLFEAIVRYVSESLDR